MKGLGALFPALVLAACASAPAPGAPALAGAAGVSEGNLVRHVRALSGAPRPGADPRRSGAVLAYLERELQGYGYAVEREPVPGGPPNLIATRRGTMEPDRVLEVGAHWDTLPGTPGADDNASGVAGVLEIARIVAGTEPARTVRFCLFSLEEVAHRGSRAHVAGLTESERSGLQGIVVLEMIGYATDAPGSQQVPVRVPFLSPPSTGNFVMVVGNARSAALGNLVEAAIERSEPDLPYYSLNRMGGWFEAASWSDHEPYWTAGLAGVMVTDTAHLRNPNYHRPTDTAETLDPAFMTKVTRAVAAAVLGWAGQKEYLSSNWSQAAGSAPSK